MLTPSGILGLFLCAGVVVFAHRGSKARCRGQFSIAKTNRKLTSASCRLPRRLQLPFRCLFSALLAASMRLQKRRKRKDHSPKKFSALRPARQDTGCVFSTTAVSKNSPQASKNHCLFRGPGTWLQGLPRGIRNGSPGPGPPQPRGQAPQEAQLTKT